MSKRYENGQNSISEREKKSSNNKYHYQEERKYDHDHHHHRRHASEYKSHSSSSASKKIFAAEDTQKMALVYVCGLGSGEDPHLFEFNGNGEHPKVQQMVDNILQRLMANDQQQQNLPFPPPFEVLKLAKPMEIFAKIDPNASRVDHQGQYKLKFRSMGEALQQNISILGNANVDEEIVPKRRRIENEQQQQASSPPAVVTEMQTYASKASSSRISEAEIHQNQQQPQQLCDFINGEGIVDFDVLNENMDQIFASAGGHFPKSHKELIRRTFECLKKGSADCGEFTKFFEKMDECFSEGKICETKQLIKKWNGWTKSKAEQMQNDLLIASSGNSLNISMQTSPEELAKLFKGKWEEKNNLFSEQRDKLIQGIRGKEQLIADLEGQGIPYIGRSIGKMMQEFFSDLVKETYVFFHENDMPGLEDQSQLNYDFFMKLSREGKHCLFVDLTVRSAVKTEYCLGQNHISLFHGQNLMVSNYFEAFKQQHENDMKEEERKINTCMARLVDNSKYKRQNNQSNGVPIPLELPCPRAYEKNQMTICPDDDSLWECDFCGQILNLAKPQRANSAIKNFYCGCGTARIADLTFRCKNVHSHGSNYKKFDSKTLVDLLRRFTQFKEKNILILGDTGVGKSTLINSLANMLTYSTLEEAMQAEQPNCLIPAKFTLTDEKMNSREIKICPHGVRPECKECKKASKDYNENFAAADSCTQQPMAHVIQGIKGGRVRIIDTPGIGDTRGIEQDKRNVKNILTFIATIEQIHCICILLKPNNARLTVLFQYCIKELLSSLHRNAAKNIVFCFTNSRGTLYKPGDTWNPLTLELNKLAKQTGVKIDLKPENIYCVDNEAFRFLCAVKAKLEFSESDHKNFAESWERSQKEFNRMLNYVNDKLEPHCTEETTSLNEARYIITTLAKPLALITRNIQSNIAKMEDETKRLAGLNTEASDFRSKLKTQRFYIENKRLEHPRTVCVAKEHTEVQKDEAGNTRTVYKTHCHDHCYLKGVPEENYPNPLLLKCQAMDGNNCKHCGCQWDMHMHIWFEQEEKAEEVDDEEIKRMLRNNTDKKAILRKAIDNAKKTAKEWEAEQATINNIAARTGAFLKKNSIVVINDAVEKYLKLLIREAKREADDTDKDYRKVQGLEESLKAYLEEKNILEKSIAGENVEMIKPEDIEQSCRQLFRLKLSGNQIKELFNAEKEGRTSQQTYREKTFDRMIPKRASNNSHSNYQRIVPYSSQIHYNNRGLNGGSNSSSNDFGYCGPSTSSSTNQSPSFLLQSSSSPEPFYARFGRTISDYLPIYRRNY